MCVDAIPSHEIGPKKASHPMDDTEPMPKVTPARGRERRGPFPMAKLSLPSRTNAIVIAIATTITAIAMLFAAYTHGEVVALRAEVHEARVAAQTATLAADRATTAADAAQSALASAQSPQQAPDTSADTTDTTQNDQDQPDAQQTDSP